MTVSISIPSLTRGQSSFERRASPPVYAQTLQGGIHPPSFQPVVSLPVGLRGSSWEEDLFFSLSSWKNMLPLPTVLPSTSSRLTCPTIVRRTASAFSGFPHDPPLDLSYSSWRSDLLLDLFQASHKWLLIIQNAHKNLVFFPLSSKVILN